MASRSRSTRWPARAGADRLLFPNLAQGLVDRLGLKRRPAREQLVEHRPQPVNVDRGGDLAAMTRHLLGCHVRGSAEDEAGVRQAAVVLDALGQPEIGDVGLVVFIEQDVRGLQVAMQDAAQVCVVDGPGDLLHAAARWLEDRP